MEDEKVLATCKNGEVSEGFPWEILSDTLAPSHYSNGHTTCAHSLTKYDDDGTPYVTVPLTVSAYNEGGWNGTRVCLQCILKTLHENFVDVPGWKIEKIRKGGQQEQCP